MSTSATLIIGAWVCIGAGVLIGAYVLVGLALGKLALDADHWSAWRDLGGSLMLISAGMSLLAGNDVVLWAVSVTGIAGAAMLFGALTVGLRRYLARRAARS